MSVECAREECPKIESCAGVIRKLDNQCCSVCHTNGGKRFIKVAHMSYTLRIVVIVDMGGSVQKRTETQHSGHKHNSSSYSSE